MKKVIAFALCAALSVCMVPNVNVTASSSVDLTVNCSSTIRSATHCASGSLYGITETRPADIANLVVPLNPYVFNNPARAGTGYQQPVGAALPVATRLASTTGKVSIRLADIYPGWPYKFTTMTDWLSKVSSVITDKLASGDSNIYGYEIWNEPDGTWQTANGTFNNLWLQTYNLIRSRDPSALIIGPSYSYYNHSNLSAFLSYCKTNNCLPDVVCWHELSGISNVGSNMSDFKSLESTLGISKKISINEYCDSTHAMEGCPGSLGQFTGVFERYSVDSACISWWFTAYPGRLGSLLASDTAKGGGWWFMNWYGQMNGNMVTTAPTLSQGKGLDGCASVNATTKTITVLCGGTTSGTANVKLTNIPSWIGSTASVKVECASWTSKDTVVDNTTVLSQDDYTVSGSSITVNTTGANSKYGYRILVTPGSSSGIQSGHVYKLENQNSARVLGVTSASTASGATTTQWEDNGTTDHNWTFSKLSSGYYEIINVNSGLALAITSSSTSAGATVDQETYTGANNQLWTLTQISGRTYKLVNKNSSMLVGVSNMTCASGASIVQWTDNGTVDHDWYLKFVS